MQLFKGKFKLSPARRRRWYHTDLASWSPSGNTPPNLHTLTALNYINWELCSALGCHLNSVSRLQAPAEPPGRDNAFPETIVEQSEQFGSGSAGPWLKPRPGWRLASRKSPWESITWREVWIIYVSHPFISQECDQTISLHCERVKRVAVSPRQPSTRHQPWEKEPTH